MASQVFAVAGTVTIVAPATLLLLMGLAALLGRPLSERQTARLIEATVILGLLASLVVLVLMLATGTRQVPIDLGEWVAIPKAHFYFRLWFVFDRLSVPFVILTYLLVGTTGAFANRYLHREPGFGRFFLLYGMFLLGMVVATLAGTIEALFLGWELVGLSSTLLVAFFQERSGPVHNGQRVWSVYRVSDAAFLVATVALHHVAGGGDFTQMSGSAPWPQGVAEMGSLPALLVGSLLLVAAAGKSALAPFSGWLPRAMEGPTPSSAVFYGALSVHLGTYLLLRVSPILESSPLLAGLVVALGLFTAIYASITASVQTDIKSALAFSSLTQVGIITAEIGLGFRYLALVHILGHASLRALQLLRAPSLLHDYHTLENAIGDHLHHDPGAWEQRAPDPLRRRLYLLALNRGNFDALLERAVVAPFLGALRACDGLERRYMEALRGIRARDVHLADGVSRVVSPERTPE